MSNNRTNIDDFQTNAFFQTHNHGVECLETEDIIILLIDQKIGLWGPVMVETP